MKLFFFVFVCSRSFVHGTVLLEDYDANDRLKPQYPEAMVTYGLPQLTIAQHENQRAHFHPLTQLENKMMVTPHTIPYPQTQSKTRSYVFSEQQITPSPIYPNQLSTYTPRNQQLLSLQQRSSISFPFVENIPGLSTYSPRQYSIISQQPVYTKPRLRIFPKSTRYFMSPKHPIDRYIIDPKLSRTVDQYASKSMYIDQQPNRDSMQQAIQQPIRNKQATFIRDSNPEAKNIMPSQYHVHYNVPVTTRQRTKNKIPRVKEGKRNHINDMVIVRNQTYSNELRTYPNGNFKPVMDDNRLSPQTQNALKLSHFLKNVKNLKDKLKERTMKEELTFYDDDVNNKSRHRSTNFAPPTRKLGSMGSPGGSHITFNKEPVAQPLIISDTKSGSEHVTIAEKDSKIGHSSNISSGNVAQKEKNFLVKSKMIFGQSSNNTSAQFDLGLLKDKVLHSNNSKFLKRVLQVLKKYTKLLKTSMTKRNETVEEKVSNSSIPVNILGMKQPDNIRNVSHQIKDSKEKENGLDLPDGINSTKTAVKLFDILSSASKESSNTTAVNKENKEEKSALRKDKFETKLMDVLMEIDKHKNASKKEKIETADKGGKFNFDKLKFGLYRGNTID